MKMERKFKVTIGEKTFIVTVEEVSGEVKATPQPAPTTPPAVTVKPPMEEKLPEVPVKEVARVAEPAPGGEGVVRAPMPGTVLSIKRNVNDRVKAGDVLLTLEAMKMENEMYAPRSGVIKKIAVSEKQSVNYGEVLVVID